MYTKGKTYRFLIISLSLCLLLFSFNANAVTLKIASLSPDGSVWMKKLRQAAKEIKTQTEGRVKFKFYPGGVMGNDKAVMRKMRIGQLQGGAFTANAIVPFNPDIQAYNMLDKFHDYKEISYVREKMDMQMLAGLEEGGIVALGLSEIGFAYLMSTKPVRTLDDIRHSKSWVPDNDDNALEAIKSFGISPIPLPFGDVLLGLQTGMIETVAASPIAALALQWHTQIKYVIDLPLLYIYGVFAIDNKAFDRIKPQDQKIVRELMGQAIKAIDTQNRKDNQEAFKALVQGDIQLVKPTPEAYKEFQEISSRANQRQIEKGRFSKSVFDEINLHLANYRSSKP